MPCTMYWTFLLPSVFFQLLKSFHKVQSAKWHDISNVNLKLNRRFVSTVISLLLFNSISSSGFFYMCIMCNFNAFKIYFLKYCRNNILSISIVIHVTYNIICFCIKNQKDIEFLSSWLSNDLFCVKIHLNVLIHVIRWTIIQNTMSGIFVCHIFTTQYRKCKIFITLL